MLIWNLEKCLELGETYASSEDNDCLKIVEGLKAIPLKRPKRLCGNTPNIAVYKYILKQIDSDIIISVQANSPTIHKDLIYEVYVLMQSGKYNEIMTCHRNGAIYGSIWALTRERVQKYKDPYHPKPDLLIEDDSVDIHTCDDMELAARQYHGY